MDGGNGGPKSARNEAGEKLDLVPYIYSLLPKGGSLLCHDITAASENLIVQVSME